MITSLSASELGEYVECQVDHIFPDKHSVRGQISNDSIEAALGRLDYCFKYVKSKRYNTDGLPRFSHLYSDQYVIFLWLLSNELWLRNGVTQLVDKLYLLNKALHAFDCAYDTQLPRIFLIIHGAGTVLGKAAYEDFFVVHHGCTVGSSRGKYPTLAKFVGLGANSSIIGNAAIAEHASIGAGTVVYGINVPPRHSVIRNAAGSLEMRPSAGSIAEQYFILPSVT